MSVALFTAGLGDVIRCCYQQAGYRLLSEAAQPLPVIVASHNPFAIEIFRHHRNATHFILLDLAHKYEEFHAAGLRGPEISHALCEFAGIDPAEIVRGDACGHVPVFDAPDDIDSSGHIVFQPFAGNASYRSLPWDLIGETVRVLKTLPWPVFLVTRSYLRSAPDAPLHATEEARCFGGGNVTVLEHLSTPATLNLVKRCRAYVGSWSSLLQAAWFEKKPVAVFYPVRHHDVERRTGYAFGLGRGNTLARDYSQADAAELDAFLRRW